MTYCQDLYRTVGQTASGPRRDKPLTLSYTHRGPSHNSHHYHCQSFNNNNTIRNNENHTITIPSQQRNSENNRTTIPQSSRTQKRGGPWWTAPLVENNNTIEINKLTTPFSLLEPSRTLFEKAASALAKASDSKLSTGSLLIVDAIGVASTTTIIGMSNKSDFRLLEVTIHAFQSHTTWTGHQCWKILLFAGKSCQILVDSCILRN
jgi:hypothetical protein